MSGAGGGSGLPLAWELGRRFLAGRRRSRILDSSSRVALVATALGVAAQVVAMGLMSGYRGDLERKLVGGNAAIVAYPTGLADPVAAAALAREEPGVLRVDRVVYGQGILTGARGGEAVVALRGVEADGGGTLAATAEELAATGGVPGARLGSELARSLGVAPGDSVRLTALGLAGDRPRFAFRVLRCTGIFTTGFSEFDRAWVVLDRGLVEAVSGRGVISLEVAVSDPAAAPALAERLERRLGPEFLVTPWQELNRDLFAALRLQQIGLFLLLGLIVLVATFNVASSLVVLVRERQRDLGVLSALGVPPSGLRGAVMAFGMLLGSAGTAAGAATGWVICELLTRFELVRFEPEVAEIYFLRSVPFRVGVAELAAVVLFSLAVTLLSCLWAARRAGRLQPASALRYE